MPKTEVDDEEEDSESSDEESSRPGLIPRTQDNSSDEDNLDSEENLDWNSDDEDQIQNFKGLTEINLVAKLS